MDKIKIEKGIDIKTYREVAYRSGHLKRRCRYSETLLKCDIGDSFLIPDKTEDNDRARSSVSQMAGRRGWKIATRLAGKCPKTGKYKRRVWRIE